jgi:hypothetical protein
MENGFIEWFNARRPDEPLNVEIFILLKEAGSVIEGCRLHFSLERALAALRAMAQRPKSSYLPLPRAAEELQSSPPPTPKPTIHGLRI